MASTAQQRQAVFRDRLDKAGKTIVRLTVTKDVAARLRRLAHEDFSRQNAVLIKALDALEAIATGETADAA